MAAAMRWDLGSIRPETLRAWSSEACELLAFLDGWLAAMESQGAVFCPPSRGKVSGMREWVDRVLSTCPATSEPEGPRNKRQAKGAPPAPSLGGRRSRSGSVARPGERRAGSSTKLSGASDNVNPSRLGTRPRKGRRMR
jgi:hypothetical protein